MSDAVLTHDMLMALEEMPPHTLFRSMLSELISYPAQNAVYRCDCLPMGAYVIICDRLAAAMRTPRYWTLRDDFLLDLGYRGVRADMVWHRIDAACPCDDPEIAASLATICDGLKP